MLLDIAGLCRPYRLASSPHWRKTRAFPGTKAKSGKRRTVYWRGMDSKFQFRDASPPPTAWAPSFRAGEWRLLEPPKQLYRFAEADDRSGDSPAPTVDRGKRVGPLDQHPDRPRSAPSRGSRRSGPSCSIRQSTTQSRGSRWNVGTALQLIRSIVEVTRGILGSSRPSSTPIFALIRALPRRVAQGRRVRLIGDRAEGALSLPARILRGPRRPVAADHIPALPPFGRLPRAISARKCASARISCNPIIVLPRARLH